MLQKFPQHIDVVDMSAKAFTLSGLLIRSGIPPPLVRPPQLVSSFISVLSSFDWKNHFSEGALFIETTGNIFVFFASEFFSDTVSDLAAVYKKALDIDTYDGLLRPAIEVASGFPEVFSAAMYKSLDAHGVHKKLRETLVYYEEMTDENLADIVSPLLLFVKACPTSAQEYINENHHITLFFAAQKFHSSAKFQIRVWQLQLHICRSASQYFIDLCPSMVVDAIATILQAQDRATMAITPAAQFLGVCGSLHKSEMIPACVDKRELLDVLSSILDSSREISSDVDKDELEMASHLVTLLSSKVPNQPTIEPLVQSGILNHLKNVAAKWPNQLASTACDTLGRVILHFPPDPTLLSPSEAQPTPEPLLQIQQKFFADDYHLFLQTLLSDCPSLPDGVRAGIYGALHGLLIFCPKDFAKKCIDQEFLKAFFDALVKDCARAPMRIHAFAPSAQLVLVRVEQFGDKDDCQFLTDQEIAEKLTTVLSLCSYQEALTSTLNVVEGLLNCYRNTAKDTMPFAKSGLPTELVALAFKLGKKGSPHESAQQPNEILESLQKLLLDLTTQKNSSEELLSQGFMTKMCLLATGTHEMVITFAALHVVGNLCLHCNELQTQVLTDRFHIKLLDNVSHPQSIHEQILKASCRVLGILSNGYTNKKEIIGCGVLDAVLNLLNQYVKNVDVCWRTLSLLVSIGFISVCNLEVIFTETIVKEVYKVFKTSVNPKIISYAVLIFLIIADLDKHMILMRNLCIADDVQKVSQVMIEADSDLKRWHGSFLEKCNLFTVGASQSVMENSEERLVVDEVNKSVSWPLRTISDSVSSPYLLPEVEELLVPQHPTGPSLSAADKLRLSELGLSPDEPLFRIGRLCGNNFKTCSNCESTDQSPELVFRPESLTLHQYQVLVDSGWYRRGGVDMFRVRYVHSLDCSDWETRVILSEFNHRSRKSYRKVLKKVPDSMTIETIPTQFVRESFELYNEYNIKKHDKSDISSYYYHEHAVNSPIRNETVDGIEYGTHHQLYRLDGKLVAVGLIDIVPNGVVSLYMWYSMSKEMQKLSLGVYSALKEIEFAQKLSERNPNIKYYYLQGWNGNNHKLSYKANYTPGDFYSPCTVTDWVCGLDGVKKAQEGAREKWRQAQEKDTATDQTDSGEIKETPVSVEQANSVSGPENNAVKKDAVPGDALPLDRVRRERLTGSSSVDVGSVVICLNHQRYLPFRELVKNYQLEDKQRELLETRLEELVLAVGPELSSNMVIDMKACSLS